LKSNPNSQGYLQVRLWKECKGKTQKIHRLIAIAFLENPDNLPDVDHINQIKSDNRIENLRWCSCSNNMRNIKKKEGCSSNYRGVNWYKKINKWQAQIIINGKKKGLGYFDTEEEAYLVWCAFVRENNLHEFYGI